MLPIFNFQFSIFNLQFLLCLLLLAGCHKQAATSDRGESTEEAVSGRYHEELLQLAVDNLNRLEEFNSPDVLRQIIERLDPQKQPKPNDPSGKHFDPLLASWPEPEILRQVVDRLNQWIRAQPPPAEWKLDPLVSGLPKPLADLPQVKDLGQTEFSRFDGYALQEAVWLRDISRWARGDAIDDLERAKSLFDWTVRNIQLEPDDPNRIPRFPWETLLYGQGTASERAWVFILLLRQLDIDAAVLAVDEGRGARDEGREEKGEKRGEKGEGKDNKNAPGPEKATENKKNAPGPRSGGEKAEKNLQPWCVGVLIEGNVYLFDPLLGLPIPAPNGVTRGADGQLAIQPATLAQVAADDKLLRRLDADGSHVYDVKASQLKQVTALLEASPPYLARRMKSLESQPYLAGPRKMVLTTSPSTCARRWREAKHIAEARLWVQPFHVLRIRSHLTWPAVQALLRAALPSVVHAGALGHGRVLQLKGKFSGDDGATRYYQIARPPNEAIALSSADPGEKLVYIWGKQDASYWSGLIAYQRGSYAAAIDYFMNRTLLAYPDGPWTDGARYNLARSYEASGDTQRAILQYGSNDASPGYLGDLLRAKWLREKGGPRKAEGG